MASVLEACKTIVKDYLLFLGFLGRRAKDFRRPGTTACRCGRGCRRYKRVGAGAYGWNSIRRIGLERDTDALGGGFGCRRTVLANAHPDADADADADAALGIAYSDADSSLAIFSNSS